MNLYLENKTALVMGSSQASVRILDNLFFEFTGITADQFRDFVATGASDEEMAAWVQKQAKPRDRRPPGQRGTLPRAGPAHERSGPQRRSARRRMVAACGGHQRPGVRCAGTSSDTRSAICTRRGCCMPGSLRTMPLAG